MPEPPDHRSLSAAVAWATQITTVAMEMVAPAVLGYFADQRLGTQPAFLALGGVLGLTLGVMTLVRLAARMEQKPPKR